MNPDADQDETLMNEVAHGATACLGTLLGRHATPLLSFITRMVGDRHRGEEIFQEVFLAVWLKRRLYQYPRPFKAWLYTIAVNKCRAVLRLKQPNPGQLPSDDLASSNGQTPADAAISDETSQRLRRALSVLPPQQRAVVSLRIWDEMSYGRIASIVGCTEATARSHMSQGLAALRTHLVDRQQVRLG